MDKVLNRKCSHNFNSVLTISLSASQQDSKAQLSESSLLEAEQGGPTTSFLRFDQIMKNRISEEMNGPCNSPPQRALSLWK